MLKKIIGGITALALGGGVVLTQVPAFASTSAQQADQIALHAVPGSTLLHTSADHMKGVPVWDIHVSLHGQVWDVKVNDSNGTVALKKLSNEQPPALTSGSISQDSAPDSSQQLKSSNPKDVKNVKDAKDHQNHSPTMSSGSSVMFGQKTSLVPLAYQSYVGQALTKVGGTLKWVKFSHKDSGDLQMNIKIRKNSGGTTKVKDVFNSSNQLISQHIPNNN